MDHKRLLPQVADRVTGLSYALAVPLKTKGLLLLGLKRSSTLNPSGQPGESGGELTTSLGSGRGPNPCNEKKRELAAPAGAADVLLLFNSCCCRGEKYKGWIVSIQPP